MGIGLDVRDAVAWLTLARPFSMNSFNEAQIDLLATRLAEIEARDDVHAVVVTGSGRAFSVGLDLELLGRAFEDPAFFRAQLDRFGAVLTSLERLPVPTIAAVNGLTRAGGFELMLCCDLIIVAEEAQIGDTHLAAGVPPGGGATARLPRRIGQQAARELLLSGRWLEDDEAVDIGLALRSVPEDQLHQEAADLARTFTSLSRPALAATKAILNDAADLPLDAALALELERFEAFVRNEPTAAEGYRAFVERREPRWR
jgi:enoyl-CoA hydratase/carnithine racemase